MLAALRLQYSQSLPWVILLLIGFVAMVLIAYRQQVGSMPRRWRWLLPALRLTAVASLGLSILRPVITRPRSASERAPVVILLDDSASMGVVDSSRPAAEWVAIAAALGRLPAEARDTQIDSVQTRCDHLSAKADEVVRARAELDYAKLSGRDVDPAQARLDQASEELQSIARDATTALASMRSPALDRTLAYLVHLPAGVDRETWLDRVRDKAQAAASYAEQARISSDGQLFRSDEKVRAACSSLQLLSRLQLAEAATADRDGGLLVRMGTDTAIACFGISDQVTPLPVTDHRTIAGPLRADGVVSNLTGGLRAVLESLSTTPPRAVVLFSDGRLTGADTDAGTLAVIKGVPVYTVAVAARAGLRDLSITSAIAPATATIGEPFAFNAELRSLSAVRGIEARITVTGGGPDETRQVVFADDRSLAVSFNRQFDSAGLHRLTLEISDIPGELSESNNKIERWVDVSAAHGKAGATTRPATRPAIEAEMADLTGDEGWLRRLSESSGGEFLRLDQINLLPKRLNEIREDVNHPVDIPLWDSPYLYVLVLGSLATEWGLRKRYGLA